ncbi:MAG: hypothetical protein V4727_06695 [Verrucomicrobiota bacterium]
MKPSSGSESRKETRPLDITLDLSPRQESYSYSNRRSANTKTQRLYPLLLLASTAVAGVFCFAYITKPVLPVYSNGIETAGASIPVSTVPATKPVAQPNDLLGTGPKNQTPATKRQLPPAPLTSGFEETNIRMQHILDAESTSGDIHRIVVDVPVLYKSRNLRWSQEDAAQARVLLHRLEAYQEKSRALRDEGQLILEDWNKLMDASIPNHILRADSPSISTNLLKTSRLNQTTESEAVKIQREQESP